ncbi:acyltransferase [Cryobacterium sp. TMT1-21]|nr:acyltransferase [Cryobacterium sp. TMT1-21]TFD18620.1 acyltransferase [Cryobacterium sp. TMT4-10]
MVGGSSRSPGANHPPAGGYRRLSVRAHAHPRADSEAPPVTMQTTRRPRVKRPAAQLNTVQLARGFAALAVVAYHPQSTEVKYFSGTNILPEFLGRGLSGVDLFFVISGFVMVLTTRGKHGTPRQVGKFVWNRFFRIYPTYWVYSLALLPVLPVLFLAPAFINSSQGGQIDILSSFLLLPTEILPLLLVAWTLTIEVWFYVVFAVVLFLPERMLVSALAVWFALLVIVNWAGPISANPYLELPTNAMAIEFILGGVAALLFRHVNRVVAAVLAVTGIVVLLSFGATTPADLYAGPGLDRPLTLGVGFALLLLAATALEHRRGIGALSRLTVLGDMFYSVYLCHVLVLAVTGRVWLTIAGSFAANPIMVAGWWVVTLAAVLTVGYLSYRLIERPVMTVAHRWRAAVFHEKDTGSPAGATSLLVSERSLS